MTEEYRPGVYDCPIKSDTAKKEKGKNAVSPSYGQFIAPGREKKK